MINIALFLCFFYFIYQKFGVAIFGIFININSNFISLFITILMTQNLDQSWDDSPAPSRNAMQSKANTSNSTRRIYEKQETGLKQQIIKDQSLDDQNWDGSKKERKNTSQQPKIEQMASQRKSSKDLQKNDHDKVRSGNQEKKQNAEEKNFKKDEEQNLNTSLWDNSASHQNSEAFKKKKTEPQTNETNNRRILGQNKEDDISPGQFGNRGNVNRNKYGQGNQQNEGGFNSEDRQGSKFGDRGGRGGGFGDRGGYGGRGSYGDREGGFGNRGGGFGDRGGGGFGDRGGFGGGRGGFGGGRGGGFGGRGSYGDREGGFGDRDSFGNRGGRGGGFGGRGGGFNDRGNFGDRQRPFGDRQGGFNNRGFQDRGRGNFGRRDFDRDGSEGFKPSNVNEPEKNIQNNILSIQPQIQKEMINIAQLSMIEGLQKPQDKKLSPQFRINTTMATEPLGLKCWPTVSIYVKKSKVSLYLSRILDHNCSIIYFPYSNYSMNLYPGNMVNQFPFDYRKKLKEKNKPIGQSYFQRCVGIKNFQVVAFAMIKQQDSETTVKSLQNLFDQANRAEKQLLQSVIIPYSTQLGSLKPIVKVAIQSLEKYERFKEIIISTNDPKTFCKSANEFLEVIQELADNNDLVIQ